MRQDPTVWIWDILVELYQVQKKWYGNETSQRNVQGIRIENANASQGPLLRHIGFTTWKLAMQVNGAPVCLHLPVYTHR